MAGLPLPRPVPPVGPTAPSGAQKIQLPLSRDDGLPLLWWHRRPPSGLPRRSSLRQELSKMNSNVFQRLALGLAFVASVGIPASALPG